VDPIACLDTSEETETSHSCQNTNNDSSIIQPTVYLLLVYRISYPGIYPGIRPTISNPVLFKLSLESKSPHRGHRTIYSPRFDSYV
jgi:hypothetical protein